MTRTQKAILMLISYGPVLVLIVLSAIYITRQGRQVATKTDYYLADELSRRFHRYVSIGGMNTFNIGTAVIKDVSISKGKSPRSGTLLSAHEVIVHYDWRAFAFGGKGAGAVTDVKVIDPYIYLVRQPDGSFNIADLLKPPPGPHRPPFTGVVKVEGADIDYLDYHVKARKLPVLVHLHDVSGTVDASKQPVYSFNGNASGNGRQFASADFRGQYLARKKQIKLDVSAHGASAPLLVQYIWTSKSVKDLAGKLDVIAGFDFRRTDSHYTTSIVGTAKIAEGTLALSFLHAPITGVNGKLIFTGNRAAGNFKGNFKGSPIHATGSIVNFKKPETSITITSPRAEFQQLIAGVTFLSSLDQFHPRGSGPIQAKITGLLSSPAVEVSANIPRAMARGVAVQNIQIAAGYVKKHVAIRSLRFTAKGASIFAAGTVALTPGQPLSLQGKFSHANLTAVAPKTSLPIAGTADGSVTISGSAADPRISMNARVVNGKIDKLPFAAATGRFGIVGKNIDISELKVSGIAGGALRVAGSASSSALDLDIVAEGIDIGDMAKDFDQPGYAGKIYLSGRVTGSTKSPYISGSTEIFKGKFGDHEIDHAVVTFAGAERKLNISQAIVQVFPAELRVTGDVTGLSTDRVGFNGKASVQRLEIQKVLSAIGRDADITGTLIGDISFSGAYLPDAAPGQSSFADLTASGSVSLEDGTAMDYPISSAIAKLTYSGNELAITEANVTSEGAQLALTGTVNTSSKQVRADYKLTGFDLTRLQDMFGDYAIVAGTAGATGTITGPWDNISASTTASIDGLTVNYEKFDRATAELKYTNGIFSTYSATLTRGAQTAAISGTDYNPETNSIASVKGVLKDISVPDIWDIIHSSPYVTTEASKSAQDKIDHIPNLTSGTLNGTFQISGSLDAPNGSLNMTATNVGIDVQQIESINLQASANKGVITLDQLQAVSGEMSLDVTGHPFYADGELNLELNAQNLDLSRLRPWLGANTPGGTMSALFTVQGAADAPDIKGSVEVVHPSFRGIVFDRLRASTITVTANRIEIPDILLTSGSHQAVAEAYLPWDWSTLSIPNDEPLRMMASLNKQNLNLLGVFVPMIDPTRTTGTIEAQLRAEGTLVDLQLSGSATVANGTIALSNFTNTFTNVDADLSFSGDKVVVNSASASSSQGGTVFVVPGGYMTVGISGASEANFQVIADGLMLGERNLLGFQENVTTQVDAGLAVTGSPAAPLISDAVIDNKPGGVAFSNSRFAFTMPSNPIQHSAPLFPINPRFNMSIKLGQDVVIAPPSMSIVADGGGKLTGTLVQPDLALDLGVVSGDVNLATARLHLISGGHIYMTYAPPAAPEVKLDLQATTSVFAQNAFNQRERYQVTMAITGTANNPQIQLSSSPPGLTREQMLAALGHVPGLFTPAEAGLQQELADVLTAVGTSTVFAPIENLFVQKLGFEQFTLEYSPIYPLSIYASRHLFGNYYISLYRQITGSLTSTSDVLYQLILNYRLKSIYQLSAGIDNQQTLTFEVGYAKAFR